MLGKRVHNFRIVRLLGEGGMGTVYEAEHLLIRRKVAVKLLKPELAATPELVQRFFNEARATSAIRHPNIIEVLDVGRLRNGVPYLVMELLEGESLADRIDRLTQLAIRDAVEFTRQAAGAIEAAHQNGIVHRDLKPDNLFLVRDERNAEREVVKVLDFGIAKLRGDPAAVSVETMAGALFGTPGYMSPEQCRGVPSEVDHRTDIYALGIILYEALCGRLPFEAEGFGDMMMLHMTGEPPRTSEFREDVPPRLERVIQTALAKRREDRYASMGEFRIELEASLSGTPGVARAAAASTLQPPPAAAHEVSATAATARIDAGVASPSPASDAGATPRARRAPVAVATALAVAAAATLALLRPGSSAAPAAAPASAIEPSAMPPRMPEVPAAAPNPPLAAPALAAAAEPAMPNSAADSTGPAAPQRVASPRSSRSSGGKRGNAPRVTPRGAAAAPSITGDAASKAKPEVSAPSEPRITIAEAMAKLAPPSTEPAVANGYLSLDSAPWSNVLLGGKLLGTTPLVRVPLPPGRHVLTLQNPELGKSTSYVVEIKSGATVKRMVGLE